VANFAQYLMFGLSDSPTSSLSYTDIDYGWNTNPAGEGRIYESGVDVGVVVSVSVGDVLQVAYSGNRIDYTQNNTVIYSHATSGAQVLYLDTAFFGSGAVVSNITFAKAGANGANGGGASSVSVAIDVTTVNWPYPITLKTAKALPPPIILALAASAEAARQRSRPGWKSACPAPAATARSRAHRHRTAMWPAISFRRTGPGHSRTAAAAARPMTCGSAIPSRARPHPGAVDHTTSTMTIG
jgi:hypothetical protein